MSIHPDLIELSPHVASLDVFRSQGIKTAMEETLRLFRQHYQLDREVELEDADCCISSIKSDGMTEREALRLRTTLQTTVKITWERTVGVRRESLGGIRLKVPRMTERASFIVDGVERVPIAQLVHAQGLTVCAYERSDRTMVWEARIQPEFGAPVIVFCEVDSESGSGQEKETWTVQVRGWKGRPAELAAQCGWDTQAFESQSPPSPSGRQPTARKVSKELLVYLEQRAQQGFERWCRNMLKQRTAGSTVLEPNYSLESRHILWLIDIIKQYRDGRRSDDLDPEDLALQRVLLVGDHLQQAMWWAARQWSKRLHYQIQRAQEAGKSGLEGSLNDRFGILEALIQRNIDRYLTGPLCQPLDRTNPLAELSHKRKVTRYGPGGLPDDYRDKAYRDIHPSQYGRLCPVETPETEKLGLTLHLATYARARNHQIEAPFRRVDNHRFAWLTAAQERNGYTRVVDPPDGPKLLRHVTVKEELTEEDGGRHATWEDACSGQSLGLAASLIPFIQHDDVNRALMGAKNMKQALPLMKPELPLVRTGLELIAGKLAGRVVRATCNGRVTRYDEAQIDVGATPHLIPEATEGWLGSRLAYRPVVTVGQQVQAGDVLAEGPAMVGESLALGVNLLVAYLPWYGYNFEDGIVISDRLVREDLLTSLHEYVIDEELKSDEVTGVPVGETPGPLDQLGEDGLIRPNLYVQEGALLARLWRISKRDSPTIEVTHRTEYGGERRYTVDKTPRPLDVPPGVCGLIKDVEPLERHGKRWLRITILEERRVTVGDKLMGRHGNKGVITRIVPEAAMPHLEDGTPIDVLLNPLGVIGRLNLGQLLETHVGLVVRNKGEEHRLHHPFTRLDLEQLKGELVAIGFPEGKTKLVDGWTGQPFEAPVVVGYQYLVKLNHLAAEKEQARETGPYAPVTMQAVKGRVRHGGQRVGEMEMWALLAHQAEDTLAELFGPRADDLRARAALQRLDIGKQWTKELRDFQRSIPESFRVMECYLQALGLTIRRECISSHSRKLRDIQGLDIRLASNDELQDVGKPVVAVPWYTKRIWGKLSCGCEGYFDELLLSLRPYLCNKHKRTVTLLKCQCGEEGPTGRQDRVLLRDRAGRLVCKMCNSKPKKIRLHKPIRSEGCSRVERGYTRGGIFCEDVFGAADTVRLEPCGCRGMEGDIVKEHVGKRGQIIRQCKTHSGDIRAIVPDDEQRRTTWGVIRLAEPVGHPLTRQKDRKTHAVTYNRTLQYIPVLPPALRPHGSDSKMGSDLNWLYERVIRINDTIAKLKSEIAKLDAGKKAPERDKRQQVIELVKAKLQLRVDELILDGGDHNGRHYRSAFGHLKGKWGTIRHDLLGRRVDASGRAVIVGAPALAPDQVALPRRMAETLFRMPAHETAAFIRKHDARVLLNRQPSLHRYSILALRPVVWDRPVIGLPPLITSGFNADFDGDTMACYCPVLARTEAERMGPERHVRSIANSEWMLATGHELAAGLWVGTQSTHPALIAARGSSAHTWNAKMLKEMLMQEWESHPAVAMNLAQEVATLAFGEATRAGLSFSHFDLAPFWLPRDKRNSSDWQNQVITKMKASSLRHPLRAYFEAGTKLNKAALGQLAGKRGEFPRLRSAENATPIVVTSNLYEGVHPLEFVASAHGSRTSLGDKKLGVADTGTFTRHLVHAAFDLRIVKESCEDTDGIWLTDLLTIPDEKDRMPKRPSQLHVATPLWQRLIGRTAIEFVSGTSITAGDVIDEQKAEEVETAKVGAVRVRSPLTCQAGPGRICAACYGWDLSTQRLPEEGLWVGIIAGQSIGERATQLTFRTFHTGGAGGRATVQGFGRAQALFMGRALDVPIASPTAVNRLNKGKGKDVYEIIHRWEEKQVSNPFKKVDPPSVIWEEKTNNVRPDTLSAIHLEFRAIYKDSVYEKHAEVIRRALQDADLKSIRRAAGRASDPMGALAFGNWQALLKELQDGEPVTLPLTSPRAQVLLGWPGR